MRCDCIARDVTGVLSVCKPVIGGGVPPKILEPLRELLSGVQVIAGGVAVSHITPAQTHQRCPDCGIHIRRLVSGNPFTGPGIGLFSAHPPIYHGKDNLLDLFLRWWSHHIVHLTVMPISGRPKAGPSASAC